MSNNQPLLSICIPTYNRASILRECLGRLCPIISEYDDVEVFISDNCSLDETSAVLCEFESVFPFVRHIRQAENIDPDKHFGVVLKESRGTYKWLFGDSYFTQEESFKKLYTVLERADYDMCVINAPNRVTFLPQKIYTDPKVLLEELGWHMTLLSALIYHERVIKNAAFERYYNSNFIQMGVVFEYFASIRGGVTVFLSDVFVDGFISLTNKSGGWINQAYYIFCKRWYVFVMSLPLFYDYESKMICIRAHDTYSKLFSLKNVVDYKCKGWSDFSVIRKYRFFITQAVNLPYKVVLFINLLPRQLIKMLLFIRWKVMCLVRGIKND